MIRFVPRTQFGLWAAAFPLLLALAITVFVGFLVMVAMSDEPLADTWTLLTFPWQARTASVQWGFVLQKSSYLAIMAVGLSIGFRANVWNIGAEGQFAFGSIFAFGAYLLFGMPDTVWFLPIMLLFGILGGVIWALIPAALRVWANTNELLTSLMLVYVAANVLNYVTTGPWKGDPKAGQAESDPIHASLRIASIIERTDFHWGVVISAGAILILAFVVLFTTFGYSLRVAQNTPRAQKFAGFSPKMTVWKSFILSGATAGLAGAIFLSAETGKLIQSENYLNGLGFTAIVIAFLGRLHPIGIVAAALLISYVNVGATYVQSASQVDDAVADLVQVTALFAVLGTAFLSQYRVVFGKPDLSTEGAA